VSRNLWNQQISLILWLTMGDTIPKVSIPPIRYNFQWVSILKLMGWYRYITSRVLISTKSLFIWYLCYLIRLSKAFLHQTPFISPHFNWYRNRIVSIDTLPESIEYRIELKIFVSPIPNCDSISLLLYRQQVSYNCGIEF